MLRLCEYECIIFQNGIIEVTNRWRVGKNSEWSCVFELCDQLEAKKLTVSGTLKQNKPQIPEEFKPNRRCPVESALFGHNEGKTICSYVPRKGRVVVLLSSMHHDQKISTQKRKPEMIIDYNATKGGVDALDQMCANYSLSRRTRRWPMYVFYAIWNIVGVNAAVLLQCTKQLDETNDLKRRELLQKLGMNLVKPHIQRRDVRPLSRELRDVVVKLGGTPLTSTSSEPEPMRKTRCYMCARNVDKKTKIVCEKCSKHVCPNHRFSVCQNCL